MAAATQLFAQKASSAENPHAPADRTTVQTLVDSAGVTSLPSHYHYTAHPDEDYSTNPDESPIASETQYITIPVIDFSLLTSADPDQRSKAIHDLDKACQDSGFFMLVNHGVPESLMKAVLNACIEFFSLPMEEKVKLADKDPWKPVRFGTGVDVKTEKFFFWRDFLKIFVHPQFHFPDKPENFSEVLQEYSKRVRELVLGLLRGLSESLGFDKFYIEKKLDMESGFQLFAANFYPPCPQPELAIGIPAHTDYGLLTLLIENQSGGLQILRDGQWFTVNPLPNAILVNTADQLEIFTNGKYKSSMHRASLVTSKSTRISIPVTYGPSLDTVVSTSPELLERESRPAAYLPMKYKDFIGVQHHQTGKQALSFVRVPSLN